jgi:hypothetical protein
MSKHHSPNNNNFANALRRALFVLALSFVNSGALDDVPVLTLESPQINETWACYTSPVFSVTAGVHTLAVTLGEGDGMDLVDNIALHYIK